MDVDQFKTTASEEVEAAARSTELPDPVSALDRAFVLPERDAQSRGSVNPDDVALKRMGFRVGELNLLFPWNAGREVVAPPTVSHIPNTATWFSGLANVRGSLVPVVDTAAACDVARQSGVAAYLLVFGHGEDALGLLIDGLPCVVDISPGHRLARLPELPALLKGDAVSAAYDQDGLVWLDLNLDALSDIIGRSIPL